MKFSRITGLILALGLWAEGAAAKNFTLAASAELVEIGALKYLLPRFSLKTGVKVALVDDAAGADATLGPAGAAPAGWAATPVFALANGEAQSLAAAEGAAAPLVARFRDWLFSDIGERAILKVTANGAPALTLIEAKAVVAEVAAPTGDINLGETISLRHCGRCHVVNEKNRYGGIGSTPSFGALRTLPRWRERFEAFWTLNPHPSFTQVEGLTEPFDPARPPSIAPVEMTYEEVEAILAFVIQMKPKDLGGALIQQ